MSKKNKASSGKAGKKNPDKKAAKNLAKKSTTKKTAAKPAKAKKPLKPVAKSKPAAKAARPVKKAVAKKPVKVSKPASKPVAKAKAKPVKAVKKPAPKAPVKAAPKKPVAKKPAPAPVKKIAKPVKPAAKSPAKPAKPAGKPVVAKEKEKPVKQVPAKAAPAKETPKPSPAEHTEEKTRKPSDVFASKTDKRVTEVLAITNTIPVKPIHELPASKIASISHSITNPVKRTDSYAIKPEKEPAGKFEMEFVVHASAEMLYEFLSTPSGLSEWFCDDLNIRNGIYTFIWEDQLQQARLLKTVELQVVRFQWVDKTDGSYFEFRIQRDDLTNDISLIITDFADSVGDRESSKLLWNSQIEKLMHVIGSIF